MATVTITITAGGNTAGRVTTVSAGAVQRLIDAYRLRFGGTLTDQEVIEGWADLVFAKTKDDVLAIERSTAINTAVGGVPDLT